MESGIYYLIARNIDTNEKIRIELTDKKEDRYCTTLTYLDSLTTQFDNKNQLIKRLYDNGYINFMNVDLYIEYSHNDLRFEEILYKNVTLLPAQKYFEELDKRNVRNFILNSSKLNLKFKEHISDYYKQQFTREGEFFKQKILDDLKNYKTFRDLYFVICDFYDEGHRKELDDLNNKRMNAKLIDYKPTKKEQPEIKEEQLEFKINNNEVQLSNPNQVVSDEVLNQVVKEHREEKEEFLTEDDWNENYYPNNIKK